MSPNGQSFVTPVYILKFDWWGNVDGPYPVGPVDVLVSEEDLALAREVVTERRLPDLDDPDPAGPPTVVDHRAPRELWLLVALVLLAAAVLLGRLLTLTWR